MPPIVAIDKCTRNRCDMGANRRQKRQQLNEPKEEEEKEDKCVRIKQNLIYDS